MDKVFNSKIKITIRTSEFLYLLAFLPYVFFMLLFYTRFRFEVPLISAIRNYIPYFTCGILIIKFFTEQYTFRYLLTFLSFLGLFLTIAVVSKSYMNIIVFALLILSLKNVNLITVLKSHLLVMVSIVFLTFLSLKFGIISNVTFFNRSDGIVRNCLGYNFPSFGQNLIFHMTCIFFYLKGNRVKWFEIIFFTYLNYYFYQNTNTKSAYYLSILLILVICLIKILKINSNYKSVLTNFLDREAIFIWAFIPILITLFYGFGKAWAIVLNNSLSTRLLLGWRAIQKYGFSLLGTPIKWLTYNLEGGTTGTYFYVDSSFLNLTLNYGFLFLMFIVLGIYLLGYKNPYRNIFFTISFTIILLHSIWDPQLIEVWYNPFILFLGVVFLRLSGIENMVK